jgi:hypothetical protein
MRVPLPIIEKLWQRRTPEAQVPFPLQMADGDFTAIDLYGGPGSGHLLRSDGVIVRWDWDTLETGEYEIETDPNWCIAALVIAAERISELKEVLPVRPVEAWPCEECSGQGFTDLPNAPRFLLCQTCWGLGWRV